MDELWESDFLCSCVYGDFHGNRMCAIVIYEANR